ncbi:hypothetical protein M422DRAFT_162772, partial [Sphaerobolus stellatus SS14]
DTKARLQIIFLDACQVGGKEKVKVAMTENGIKDTHQLHFVERLYNSYKGKRTNLTKQAALDAEIARLPVNVMSSIWQIRGMYVCTSLVAC